MSNVNTPNDHPPEWYSLSSAELIEEQISHIKFELSVAGAPLVAFSFGEAFLDGDISAPLFYSFCFLSLSMAVNYILVSQAHVLKKALLFYEAHEDAREMLSGRSIIHFGHPGLSLLARLASLALTVGYILLIYSLLTA